MPELSVEVRRQRNEDFDPHNALHLFAIGSEQQHATLDIYPTDLHEVVNKMEAQEGENFENARRFLETTADSYPRILELIRQGGQDQPRLIAAAIGFSIAAAFLEIEETVSPASAEGLHTNAIFSGVGKNVAKTFLMSSLADQFSPGPPNDPNVPTISLLLCQGATTVPGVCHYMFFLNRGSAFPCVDVCLTSLGCFTGICQPLTLARDEVDRFRGL
jgi:hypothetical protein